MIKTHRLKVEYSEEKEPNLCDSTGKEAAIRKAVITPGEKCFPLGYEGFPPPHLSYRYPKSSPEILENITKELASNAALYYQTLHLMNKMNLKPPFEIRQKTDLTPPIAPEEMHRASLSEEESELESDTEPDFVRLKMDPPSSKERLPLTNVSNVHPRKSGRIGDDPLEEQRKSMPHGYEESFFLYRKEHNRAAVGDDNPFDLLSDEVLLHILKWLPKKTLLSCGQVNRRFNRVTKDETLWQRLDLSNRSLQCNGLIEVLSRGVVVFRLAQTCIADPIPDNYLEFPQGIKVQFLDLSMCTISKPTLRELLANCRALVKLSLENVPLDGGICAEIAENRQLESLNLTMCSGIDVDGMHAMAKALTKLLSLNVSWTNLGLETVQQLVKNLTPQIMHLNIAGCRSTLNDGDVAVLIKRCPKLVALDLSDCTLLTDGAIKILCKSRQIEYLSLSRCYNIPVSSYLNLSELKTLRFLDLFGLVSDQVLDTLKHSLAKVGINKYYHSSVARPTVGTKRTSIWGFRTRD
uniref:S-phase kinase-associated protein 2 n=1 Tax=Anopheles minimus TaxID=112268 RepID=A0A182WK41_9DIPT